MSYSYINGGSSYLLGVSQYNSGSDTWSSVGNLPALVPEGNYPDFQIDPTTNHLYVVDSVQNDHKLTTWMFDGMSWQVLGQADFTAADAWYPSMTYAVATHQVYVSFMDGATGYTSSVMSLQDAIPVNNSPSNTPDNQVTPTIGAPNTGLEAANAWPFIGAIVVGASLLVALIVLRRKSYDTATR